VCEFSTARQKIQVAGHVFRMQSDRLPKKLLFGEVKGLCPPGCHMYIHELINDVSLRDCQKCCTSRPYRDTQDRLLWRGKPCPACT